MADDIIKLEWTRANLFDHLVCKSEQAVGYWETKHLGSLQIDGRLKCCWLYNRQVGRLPALQNAADVGVLNAPSYGPIVFDSSHGR